MRSYCFLTHIHDLVSYELLLTNGPTWLQFNPTYLIIINDTNLEVDVDIFGADAAVVVHESKVKKEPPYINWLKQSFFVFDYCSSWHKYMLRLDPDTVCHRPINFVPNADMFGTFIKGKQPHIQGGCIGFSIELAQAFCKTTFANPNVFPEYCSKNEHYSDLVLYRLVKDQLPLMKIEHWSEVSCHPYIEPIVDKESYAFTHPHKKTTFSTGPSSFQMLYC